MCTPSYRVTGMPQTDRYLDHVGPVLIAGDGCDAVIAAIRQANSDVVLVDRGAYVRVLCPGRCMVSARAVAEHLGRSFRLPGDLEAVMCAMKGTF